MAWRGSPRLSAMPANRAKSTKSRLKRTLACSGSAPERSGDARLVSRSELDGYWGAVQFEARHGHRRPYTWLATGADGRDPGVAVQHVTEPPSRHTGEWRDGALLFFGPDRK